MTETKAIALATNNAPNLDGMDATDLMAFWGRTHNHPRIIAAELFPSKPSGYVAATKNLGHYAANKATAFNCRLRGDIQTALNYEGIAERIYDRLPEWARW